MATNLKTGTRLREFYTSLADFEVLLEDARMNANTQWEEDFVRDVGVKYKAQKFDMFWSEKQDQKLRAIAGPEDY